MPVNNWIPVARDFTQFLDVQSQRRKKRIQQGIIQQLPQYINNELSNAKTKEDIYRKLPELSAQMFAIDPEIGAHATQIANQYGQMKLQQINEVENEETAKRGLDVLKNTFGNVNVMHKGKVAPFANVLDEITPSMRSEDALKFGETILKAGQVKREAISEFTKGKPTLTVYQMLNGEPVEKPKQYYINAKNRTLDDMSTKELESLPMGIEETKDLAKFEMGQYERRQSLGNQLYADQVRRERELEFPKPTPYTLSSGKTGLGTLQYKKNESGKYVPFITNEEGKDITKDVISNKVFASSVREQLGMFDEKDYYKKAQYSAAALASELELNNLINEDMIQKVTGIDKSAPEINKYKLDPGSLFDMYDVKDFIMKFNSKTSGGIVKEILKAKGLDKANLTDDEKKAKEDIEYTWKTFWNDYNNWKKVGGHEREQMNDYMNRILNPRSPQSIQKKGAFD